MTEAAFIKRFIAEAVEILVKTGDTVFTADQLHETVDSLFTRDQAHLDYGLSLESNPRVLETLCQAVRRAAERAIADRPDPAPYDMDGVTIEIGVTLYYYKYGEVKLLTPVAIYQRLSRIWVKMIDGHEYLAADLYKRAERANASDQGKDSKPDES